MKKLITLILLGGLFISACSENMSVPPSQSNFVGRLKRAQDTVTLFKNQAALKNRIVTNMAKYVAANMEFKAWKFDVEDVNTNSIQLKVPAPTDTAGYNVNYRIFLPLADAELNKALTAIKAGDKIKLDGVIDMKTADGKISMNDYFSSDSAKYIKLAPSKLVN